MIKVKPARKDFAAWTKCVPGAGDLIFLTKKELNLLPRRARVFSANAVKKSGRFWPLNSRSWYGYSLNKRSYGAWLKAGELEGFSAEELRDLGKTQINAKVPSLIRSSLLPVRVRKKLAGVDGHLWVTARGWKKLTKVEKTLIVRAWFIQNELLHQPSLAMSEVPAGARDYLWASKLDRILHRFRGSSGGNCFAVAAAFATKNHKLLNEWILWNPLEKHLGRSGYRPELREQNPQSGDILIFRVKGKPVHAAVYLGDGICFEKPGQDFYEPYRLLEFKKWKKEWPGARLIIFRK